MNDFKSTTTPNSKKYSLIAVYWLVIVSAVFFIARVNQDVQAALPVDTLIP